MQFDNLPDGVFLLTRVPTTEPARKLALSNFATQSRIPGDYKVVDVVFNEPSAIKAFLEQINSRWTVFSFGNVEGLFEGSVRSFRAIWTSILKSEPGAVLYEMGQSQNLLAQRESQIEQLKEEISDLKETIAGMSTSLLEKIAEIKYLKQQIHEWVSREDEDDEHEDDEYEYDEYGDDEDEAEDRV